MRRRFQLIPFDVTIPEEEQDPELGLKLEREWPGILGWMIAGAVAWQNEGLKPSKSVLSATQEYMDDEAEGVVEQWIADRCVTDSAAQTKHDDLYRSYRNFAEQSGERPITSRQLGREFVRLGYNKARDRNGRYVVGIALASLAPPPPPPPYNLPAERRP
jgi:putative DNA primase/helicase